MSNIVFTLIVCGALFVGCSDDTVRPEVEKDPCQDNNAPVIESIPDTFVTLGETLRLYPLAYDPDDEEIEYIGSCINVSWSQIKLGQVPIYSVDTNTGEFVFAPRSYDVPERIFEISVIDSCGAKASTIFTVQVIQ